MIQNFAPQLIYFNQQILQITIQHLVLFFFHAEKINFHAEKNIFYAEKIKLSGFLMYRKSIVQKNYTYLLVLLSSKISLII